MPSTTSTREFALFPKLPIELRFKIWKHALPVAHLINVVRRCFQYVVQKTHTFNPTFDTTATKIGLLTVCKGPRRIGIEHLPICFPSSDRRKEIRLGQYDALAITNIY
ncbi:hypothetical protein BDZ45DRAFT_755225 [Acephala macrosclerotiorum]|nr:hypothetical protein BDZ45DRAFT_755225 [Acephala macrosclerotiorum]